MRISERRRPQAQLVTLSFLKGLSVIIKGQTRCLMLVEADIGRYVTY
jgi:hypothetical protein